MICKRCGQEIPEGVVYCGNCGMKVGKKKVPVALILVAAVLVLGIVAGSMLLSAAPQEPTLSDGGNRETIAATEPAETRQPWSEPPETEMPQTEPPQTEPPQTEPPQTNPPETEPEDGDAGVPEELRNNILLFYRDKGACEKMVGDVTVTVVFADVPEGGWSDEEIDAMKQALTEEARLMMEEAGEYGAELNMQLQFLETTAPACAYGEEEAWADAALEGLGLPPISGANLELEARYGVEAAPVIFYLNVSGRSRACWASEKDGREFAILYIEANAFRHEMSHLFGAVDYYYPDLVQEHGTRLFPGSLMYSNDVREVDSMTAYLIGWTDTLSPEAEEFLRLTNELTWETYTAEMENEYITGYVTREYDYGTYTGYLVDGLMQGYGKLVWDSGTVYEGEWYFGNMHGQGTMTWADGMVYTGQWVNGERHGQGKLTWADGSWYEGEWVAGMRHGYGILTWTDGTNYRGQWENDKRNGQGVLTFASGTVQSGQFKDDEFIG